MSKGSRIERELFATQIRYISGDDDDDRLSAIEALVTQTWDPAWDPDDLISQDGLPAMVACLDDKDPRVRSAAAELLKAITEHGEGDAVVLADALPELERHTHDDDDIVRRKVNEVLALLKTQGCF
jgi:hypothetical protein